MNKTEFRDLLLYLETRPEDAALLSAALEKAKGKGPVEPCVQERLHVDSVSWHSVSQVADTVRMSTRWVRDRVKLLPDEMVREKRMGKRVMYWLSDGCFSLLCDMKTR